MRHRHRKGYRRYQSDRKLDIKRRQDKKDMEWDETNNAEIVRPGREKEKKQKRIAIFCLYAGCSNTICSCSCF
jgi:hypothetical protein